MNALIFEDEKLIKLSKTGFDGYSMWSCEEIENVKTKWLDKNKIQITGDLVQQEFYWNDSDKKKFAIDDVEPEFIETYKFFWKTYRRIRNGWITLKKRLPFNHIYTNFRIDEVR